MDDLNSYWCNYVSDISKLKKKKEKKKEEQGKVKGIFLKKGNGNFLNWRNMIFLITLFIDFIIKL